MKIKLLSIIAFFCVMNCFATDYYISNSGNDNNNGTSINTPWQTLSKLSSELIGPSGTAGSISTGDRVFFKKGDTFRGTILFSAYNNNGVTFDSYGSGELPLIKGSKLTSNWTVHNGNIWKTTVSERVYFLFINNIAQTLARMPNTGTWNMSAATENSLINNLIASSGKNFVGANVCLRENDWRLNRQIVTAQSGNNISWATNINAPATNANFYFDNKLELLDANGEWFYDMTTQTLYLMSATNPNSLIIEASTNLLGIAGNDNRSDNIIQNIQFQHFADQAIRLMGAANNNLVSNCKFKNNFTPIFVSGNQNTIQNNTIEDVFFDGLIVANMANSNITNNTILNVGLNFGQHKPNFLGEFYSSGIWLINANPGCTIANNTILNCGNNGIRFGGTGIIIEKNYLENILLNMSDGGAIYTWGSNSNNNMIRKNNIKNVIGDLNGVQFAGIVNGIYIDNNCFNIQIDGNTVENVNEGAGILINAGAHNNTITNNVIYKCKQGLFFADWLAGKSVYNNAVTFNTFYTNLQNAFPIQIASDDNNHNTMSVCNNNFLANPYNSAVVSYLWTNTQSFTLSQWQTATGFDSNSFGSFYNWTLPTDNSFLVKNQTPNPVTYNYTNTVNLNNNLVSSLTLQGFSSKVLISTVALSANQINVLENEISIFPNPSTGKFNVNLLNEELENHVKIEVYTLDGKLILDKKINAKFNDFNLFQKGIYIAKISSSDKNYVKKIIVN
jgi:parallel beta-helix repeat protein